MECRRSRTARERRRCSGSCMSSLPRGQAAHPIGHWSREARLFGSAEPRRAGRRSVFFALEKADALGQFDLTQEVRLETGVGLLSKPPPQMGCCAARLAAVGMVQSAGVDLVVQVVQVVQVY